MTTPAALTVNSLIVLLETLRDQGAGEHPVQQPYSPAQTTMGGTPTLPVVGVDAGFDWDHGKVMLRLSEPVGTLDVEVRRRLRVLENTLMTVTLNLQQGKPAEAQNAAMKGMIKAFQTEAAEGTVAPAAIAAQDPVVPDLNPPSFRTKAP